MQPYREITAKTSCAIRRELTQTTVKLHGRQPYSAKCAENDKLPEVILRRHGQEIFAAAKAIA